jgi:hypothetical protein
LSATFFIKRHKELEEKQKLEEIKGKRKKSSKKAGDK